MSMIRWIHDRIIYSIHYSIVGLVLAFLGAQTRMREAADVPVQKVLGIGKY